MNTWVKYDSGLATPNPDHAWVKSFHTKSVGGGRNAGRTRVELDAVQGVAFSPTTIVRVKIEITSPETNPL